jgi:hypothetical protein
MGNQYFDIIDLLFWGRRRLFHDKHPAALRAFEPGTSGTEFSLVHSQLCFAFRAYYDQCLILLGNHSFIVIMPIKKPPTWANHAIPPS